MSFTLKDLDNLVGDHLPDRMQQPYNRTVEEYEPYVRDVINASKPLAEKLWDVSQKRRRAWMETRPERRAWVEQGITEVEELYRQGAPEWLKSYTTRQTP